MNHCYCWLKLVNSNSKQCAQLTPKHQSNEKLALGLCACWMLICHLLILTTKFIYGFRSPTDYFWPFKIWDEFPCLQTILIINSGCITFDRPANFNGRNWHDGNEFCGKNCGTERLEFMCLDQGPRKTQTSQHLGFIRRKCCVQRLRHRLSAYAEDDRGELKF